MTTTPERQPPYRVGRWLPSDQKVLDAFIGKHVHEAAAKKIPLAPPVQAMKDYIESNRHVFTLFQAAFQEVPRKPPYDKDPTGKPQIRDYMQMLEVINLVLTKAPAFNTTGLVGFPINAILDWPMGTVAGYTLFRDAGLNAHFKAILRYWQDFLSTPASREVLNTGPEGWLNPTALKEMAKAAYGTEFTDIFECPSNDINDHYGFKSWDHFFTRVFKPGVRPIAAPGDDRVITNACESAPYRLVHGAKKVAPFWVKGQPYSLLKMMNHDALADQFDGATVYQAFLSALSFHRWNSPVSGKIVKAYVVDGTYYAEDLYYGFRNPGGPDDAGPNDSQGYITEEAARAVIFIQADNPDIGLMCFLAVGMAEVSSNEITVTVGQHVNKGDQLGMFHFGGSTHCLIFRPGVNLEFDLHGQKPGLESTNIKLNSAIAKVLPST